MGPDATWKDPNQVKRRFYDVIARKLEGQLGRRVDLVVEKDKHRSGSIYSSMYGEAWTADVYLADLTGLKVTDKILSRNSGRTNGAATSSGDPSKW